MIIGSFNLDGKDYDYVIDGNRILDPNTNEPIQRVWAYPVRQGVWGGEPETLYFSTKEAWDAYIKSHDHCDKLPRRKVPEID